MSVTVDGVGEVMALLVEMGRPIILVGPADNPEVAEMLWVGPRFLRPRAAMRHGQSVYFRLYFERYGFRHPNDPHASPGQVMPASVIVAQGEGNRIASHSFDPDQRTQH